MNIILLKYVLWKPWLNCKRDVDGVVVYKRRNNILNFELFMMSSMSKQEEKLIVYKGSKRLSMKVVGAIKVNCGFIHFM